MKGGYMEKRGKKRLLILSAMLTLFFASALTVNAEENYKDIVLYDFDKNTLDMDLGGSPTYHTLKRVYIEDKGQTIYPIYSDYTQFGDTYRPIAYFIVCELSTELHITKEIYDYVTGETTTDVTVLNVNNHFQNYRDLYNSNTNYYNYLKQFGFYPNNSNKYDVLNTGPLCYYSYALLKAESYPTQYSTFTNYVDNDVMEYFFSDYSGDRLTTSSVVSLSGTYQNKMNYYDFIPYLHDSSTVKTISNPISVTEPEPFPPEPEPEPEPLPPAGEPNIPPSGVDMNVSIQGLMEIVAKAWKVIVDNSVLMILFCSGLLGVAFRIIIQAKKSARK